jgi:hypothetical protein
MDHADLFSKQGLSRVFSPESILTKIPNQIKKFVA